MITLSEVEYGRQMLAMVKEEYETGNLIAIKRKLQIACRITKALAKKTMTIH